jgi:hypothetical protein
VLFGGQAFAFNSWKLAEFAEKVRANGKAEGGKAETAKTGSPGVSPHQWKKLGRHVGEIALGKAG